MSLKNRLSEYPAPKRLQCDTNNKYNKDDNLFLVFTWAYVKFGVVVVSSAKWLVLVAGMVEVVEKVQLYV